MRYINDLRDMIYSSAEMYGNDPAFLVKDVPGGEYRPISYIQLKEDIDCLGTALTDMGLRDSKIAVIGENSYKWVVSYLAVTNGTGVVVPLDKDLTEIEIGNLIKRSEVDAIIFSKKMEKKTMAALEDAGGFVKVRINMDADEDSEGVLSWDRLIRKGAALIEDGDREFLDAVIDREAMCTLLFTSGTTGMAKGIMLSHRNIVADLMVSPTLVDFLPSDIFFSVLPIHHTFECTCNFIMPLYKGGAIAHCEGLKYIVKNIQEVHPTFLLAVPAIFEALHKAIWKGIRAKGKEKTVRKAMKICNAAKKLNIDLTNLFFKEIKQTLGGRMRMMICGGAAINPEILEDLQSFGIMALQGYGLSEAAPMGALNPENKPKSISCGIAFPGFDARINEPGADGVGEICLKGDNIMLGYYKNPEATAEVIKDGWFYTGDLGYIDDEGYIVITGRKKNVIITKNGKNVFPEELEYQLSLHDEIVESMVFEGDSGKGDGDKNGDTLIVAGIYPDWALIKETMDDEAEDDEAVKKYIWGIVDKVNAANPGYKMIRKVNLRHTEFEKNTSRKIRRFVEDNKKAL